MGFGQLATLQFRYRLRGFSQSTRQEYDILKTAYIYGSADDAVAGGREKGDNNLEVVRVFGEPNIAGFNPKQFTYSDRLTEQTNREAAERDAAYRYAQEHPGTLDLGGDGAGADNALAGLAGDNWMIIAVIAVVLIAIIAIYLGKGG
jgi:ABC-type dipeptide/oligopeptide/nickel transport system permease subunit